MFGSTAAIAYRSYASVVGTRMGVGQTLARYFGAVPDLLRITTAPSALLALLTPTLALAGATYLVSSGHSLAAVFGYAKDVASFVFCLNIGGALLAMVPVMAYSLKKKADEGRLGDPVSVTLSSGLLAASLGHLAVLGPMVARGQGEWALPWVVRAWATGALAGAYGMFSK